MSRHSVKIIGLIIASMLLGTGALAKGESYNFLNDSGASITANKAGFEIGTGRTTVEGLIGNIILAILSLLAVIFLSIAIYAGITWMTAQGNEEKIKTANAMLMNNIFGLVIVLGAYAISYFLINYIW